MQKAQEIIIWDSEPEEKIFQDVIAICVPTNAYDLIFSKNVKDDKNDKCNNEHTDDSVT